MMQRYKFVGTLTELGDRVFSRIGQSIDLDEDVYREIVRSAPFIPQEDFLKTRITDEEVDRYGDLANRCLAPDSFNAKVKHAVVLLIDIREKLRIRSAREEIPTAPEIREEFDSTHAESEQSRSVEAEPIVETRRF